MAGGEVEAESWLYVSSFNAWHGAYLALKALKWTVPPSGPGRGPTWSSGRLCRQRPSWPWGLAGRQGPTCLPRPAAFRAGLFTEFLTQVLQVFHCYSVHTYTNTHTVKTFIIRVSCIWNKRNNFIMKGILADFFFGYNSPVKYDRYSPLNWLRRFWPEETRLSG